MSYNIFIYLWHSVCDAYHWGEDCSQDCACYPIGSDRCDPVVGCICKTGWAGVHCKTDVDECQSSKSECTAPSVCVNLPGSYKCECPNGFQNVNNICLGELFLFYLLSDVSLKLKMITSKHKTLAAWQVAGRVWTQENIKSVYHITSSHSVYR